MVYRDCLIVGPLDTVACYWHGPMHGACLLCTIFAEGHSTNPAFTPSRPCASWGQRGRSMTGQVCTKNQRFPASQDSPQRAFKRWLASLPSPVRNPWFPHANIIFLAPSTEDYVEKHDIIFSLTKPYLDQLRCAMQDVVCIKKNMTKTRRSFVNLVNRMSLHNIYSVYSWKSNYCPNCPSGDPSRSMPHIVIELSITDYQ